MSQTNPDIQRFAEEHRLSGAVRHGNTLYLAGQVADDPSLDTEGQTADILRQIDALLAEAGTNKTRLLSVQIFMTDISEIDSMNRAWDAWVSPGNAPVRCTVQAGLMNPKYKVEIKIIAAL